MFQIGIGKSDITTFQEGAGMLGYGIYYNIMKEIETRLYARTFIFKNGDTKLAYVNCELGFITPSLKRGVLKKLQRKHAELGYTDENLLMVAQHTHSGPSGFSHHGLYNTSTPGFSIKIYSNLVEKITESIVLAEKNFQNADIYLGKGEFEPEKEVGFQRSIKAYLQNPEAKKITKEELHLGINREMKLLKIKAKTGDDIASINWFGTHTTNMPNTNHKVSSDNKGYAATYFEEEKGNDFVAIFAQGICGDVTPRFTYNKKYTKQRGNWDGKYEDAIKSAQYNGNLQYEKATEIHHNADQEISTINQLDSAIRYSDFGNIQVNPKYTGGKENIRTSPSCMGVAFLEGTYYDGPGMLEPLASLAKGMSLFIKGFEYAKSLFMPKEWGLAMRQKYAAQGKKRIAMETGARKIYGTHNINGLIIPGFTDEVIYNLKKFHRRGAWDKNPWTPQILPLQIVQIGSIVLAAFPFEITTIAGERLQKSIEEILLDKNGIEEVILSPYSNAYNGYITTYEEYQVQEYEGGHTVFGEWTLAALQTEFEKLCIEMLKPKNERNVNHDALPPTFTEEDLKRFEYYKGKYYLRTIRKKNRKAKREKV